MIPTSNFKCFFWSSVDKDVYRTDREVDKYKPSSSHSLTQLEDILTTYVMYNVDLGEQIAQKITHCIKYMCIH